MAVRYLDGAIVTYDLSTNTFQPSATLVTSSPGELSVYDPITGILGPSTTLLSQLALLASPALTGTPTAPTAAPLNDSTQIGTTAYTDSAVAVETARAEAAEALKAPLASPALTGVPTAPTASLGTNTTQIATTAFVLANATPEMVSSVFGRIGAIVAVSGDYSVAQVTGAAPLASPAFTGVPTAPTASAGTNTTQIATTAFDTAAVAVETSRAEAAEGLLAPKNSPTFTGTVSGITAAMVGADVSGAAATAQSNAETFATSAVNTETSRAEGVESSLSGQITAETSARAAADALRPEVYSISGAAASNPKIVTGSATIGGGGTVTITLTGSAVFSSATSYYALCTNMTSNAVNHGNFVTQSSGSSFIINGASGDVVNFYAIGN
jgi:hypothetical protein